MIDIIITVLAIRGHGDESDSNFIQLLKLLSVDDKRMGAWLNKKTDKYTAPDMQNEMLKVMALHVLRQVACLIQTAPFMSIMIDETTDVSNKEQVVICFRWVDKKLEAHEEYVGLYQVESTQASELHYIIHDVLRRLNLPISEVRGQCYDGASSMSGSINGVATKILEEEPRALYTHCYGHALNLACSDAIKGCKLMRNALDTSYEIVKLVKKSPRRDAMLQKLKTEMQEDSPGIRVLCPTRWTVRAQALQSIISNYEVLQELWQQSIDVTKDAEMRSRIHGVSVYMKSFNFFFGLLLGEFILKHSDNLSKTLQTMAMSAAEAQKIAQMTVRTLQSVRNEEDFMLFWTKVTKMASSIGVDDPVLPRQRKTPRRYDYGTAEGETPTDVQALYRPIFFEALDLVISGIKARFDQPGYKTYIKLEELLVKAANKEDYESELIFVVDFYKDDINEGELRTQLSLMSTCLPTDQTPHNLCSILKYLREISDAQRSLMCEVCTVATLILVMPASNASSERSFSSLRRIKSYLRATMTQTRLNNIMILHVYKSNRDELNLIDIGNEFIRESSHREGLFGKLLSLTCSLHS